MRQLARTNPAGTGARTLLVDLGARTPQARTHPVDLEARTPQAATTMARLPTSSEPPEVRPLQPPMRLHVPSRAMTQSQHPIMVLPVIQVPAYFNKPSDEACAGLSNHLPIQV